MQAVTSITARSAYYNNLFHNAVHGVEGQSYKIADVNRLTSLLGGFSINL